MNKFELISFATADELALHAASAWLDEIEEDNRTGNLYCVALSGGRITQKFFESVVDQAGARKFGDRRTSAFPDNVHFFWADERCVPPNDPESNFKMANNLLFEPLKVSENQIHRIRGEDSPAAAVRTAELELRRVVGIGGNSVGANIDVPILDLILLGMGEDGHVASLFPDAPAEMMHSKAPFLVVENSPKPPPTRISLNYNVIAAARQVWVLISGAGKENALRESLDLSGRTPLGRVIELRQKTLIFSQIEATERI